MTSDNDDIAVLALRDANALTRIAPISKALPGFFKTFFAIFLEAINHFLPRFLKNSPRPSTCIVLSPTVIDFFLLQIEQ